MKVTILEHFTSAKEINFTAPFLYLAQAQPSKASNLDWGMLGVVVAFLTLLAAIIIGIIQIRAAQRPKKDIRCRLVTSVPLLKVVDDRFKGDLQVTFQEKVIEAPYSIVLRVYNAGKLPIN